MSNPISDVQSVARATRSMLSERFAGYALVGFVAGCDHPMTLIDADNSPKTRMALQTMLQEAHMDLGDAAHAEGEE